MKFDLANELIKLGDQCYKVAKMLAAEPHTLIQLDDQHITISPINIDYKNFTAWPRTNTCNIHFNYNVKDMSILQYSVGKSGLLSYLKPDVLSPDIDYIDGAKIMRKYSDVNDRYDLLIINESLEYEEAPMVKMKELIELLKPGGKIFIRFRPWTSSNGSFLYPDIDKAYVHLVCKFEESNAIKMRATRPMFLYENMIKSLSLNVLNKRVVSKPVDGFFINNKEILHNIINNTWTDITESEALKIMSTEIVEYLLST